MNELPAPPTDETLTFRRWQVGAVRVTEVVELATVSAIHFILPDATAENLLAIDWAQPYYVSPEGKGKMTIRSLVVESAGRTVVVDTCLGNDKERAIAVWSNRSGPFLDHLAAAGFPPDSVDMVLCTHLHVDHVGWNTRLVDGKWVPTFPNARYLFGGAEWAHWSASTVSDDVVLMGDSVRPVIEAGLMDLVEADHRLTPELSLEPTPGHTPGHVSVRIRSLGAEAVITGDVSHHPCQLAHPEWGSSADVDRVQSEATRRAFFAANADRDVVVLGTHWEPCANRLFRDGEAYRPEPV